MDLQISIRESGDVTILDLQGTATIGADSDLLSVGDPDKSVGGPPPKSAPVFGQVIERTLSGSLAESGLFAHRRPGRASLAQAGNPARVRGFAPYDFKHPHLLEIVDANPGYKWILFGDTGERDPEVYHTLIQERPGAVDAVFIHNVTDADRRDARFAGFTLFSDWNEALGAIQRGGLGLRH